MKIFCKFPTILISKLNFWLVICIAKNFIWTTLKLIFSIYIFFFAPLDSRFSNSCISAKYCPILTNHTSIESLFIQLPDDVYIYPYDWFCGPGSHILCWKVAIVETIETLIELEQCSLISPCKTHGSAMPIEMNIQILWHNESVSI